jgi:hypothetical protein
MYFIFHYFEIIGCPNLKTVQSVRACVCVYVSSITVFWVVTPCSLIKTVSTRAPCCLGHRSAKFYNTVSNWKVRQLTVIRHTEMWELLHLLVGPSGNAFDILATPISDLNRNVTGLSEFCVCVCVFARSYLVYAGIVPLVGLSQLPSHLTC